MAVVERFMGQIYEGTKRVANVQGWMQQVKEEGDRISFIGGLTVGPERARYLVESKALFRLELDDGLQGEIVCSQADALTREVKFHLPGGLK